MQTGDMEDEDYRSNSREIVELSTEEDEFLDACDTISDINEDISGSLIGTTRKTIPEMYELYCKHARAVGFSVRKSTSRFSRDDPPIELAKLFVCSSSGVKRSQNPSIYKRKKIGLARTDCKALMRVKMNDEGLYEVVNHILLHNHTLTRIELNHLHRSERNISNEKGRVIESMITSGMSATNSFRYMVQDAGGEEVIGHTIKDHLNFVNRLKMKVIEGGDAQKVIDMIQQEQEENDDFYYKVRLDDEGRLSKLFWRDSMMKEDYEIYGDVMIFDTTYRTNRYNLICSPFVGVNNHGRNVMFGCAFLADEKMESFEWLFEVFKKSMRGKCPISLFTDQDLAIANAIEKVFPGTRHRLCLWHLQQNAVSRFAELKTDNTFKDTFNKCLSGCTDEKEFEDCWQSMISKYGLTDHPWFARLYGLKEKWCTALNKDFFSAGILSSQRSESTNHAIGFNVKKNTSLTEFYIVFKETINNWRSKERHDEFKSSRLIPESVLPLNGLLKHASEVYTLPLFRKFEDEFLKCISATSTLIGVQDDTTVYHVSSINDNGIVNRVVFDNSMNLIVCTCMKFEECGMLCYHSLRILHINSKVSIPDSYIKKRWTKQAKSQIWDGFKHISQHMNIPHECVLWRHEMARKYYNLILKCEDSKDAKRILEEGYNRDSLSINEITSFDSTATTHSESSNVVLDPTHSITKGRRQRIKGHFQKKKKLKGKSVAKEFGSKTPNVHMF